MIEIPFVDVPAKAMMIYPPALKKGDKIALINPSSPARPGEARASLNFLTEMGFEVAAGESLWAHEAGFMAGSGRARGLELNEFFRDSGICAIFCLRGGYSASSALPFLDYTLIKKNPKIFVGYSDVTALHLALNQKSELITFHGPMARQDMLRSFDAVTEKSLWRAVTATKEFYLKQSEPFSVLSEGEAEGRLVGGNLSLIAASLATPYAADCADKILFIEDVGESVPRIARMLTELRLSGGLDKIRGLMVGNFKDCVNQYDASYDVIACIRDAFADLNIPILYGISAGHCSPNLTLPLGAECVMDTKAGTILFRPR